MLKLVSLFFHLGLHLGGLNKLVSTNIYGYLLGHRFSRNIYNIRLSVLYLRKVSLFLLLASKLNHSILPVLQGFNLQDNSIDFNAIPSSIVRQSSLFNRNTALHRIRRSMHFRRTVLLLNQYKKLNSLKSRKKYRAFNKYNQRKYRTYLINMRMKIRRRCLNRFSSNNNKLPHISDNRSSYFNNDTISGLFYKYKFPVLLNTVGLINNWETYYTTIRKVFFEIIPKYVHVKSLSTFFKKKLDPAMESGFVYNCIALVMCLYYKLNLNLELNMVTYKFKFNCLVKKFRKFYVFVKFLVHLREHRQLPNILFYLDPSELELSSIRKYRICTISLIGSQLCTTNYVTYPIPSNFGTYLSKFFYATLFINSCLIGRILLVLNSIS